MPWRTATWWVTRRSTKCTGSGCCWTANFTFALKKIKVLTKQSNFSITSTKQIFQSQDLQVMNKMVSTNYPQKSITRSRCCWIGQMRTYSFSLSKRKSSFTRRWELCTKRQSLEILNVLRSRCHWIKIKISTFKQD